MERVTEGSSQPAQSPPPSQSPASGGGLQRQSSQPAPSPSERFRKQLSDKLHAELEASGDALEPVIPVEQLPPANGEVMPRASPPPEPSPKSETPESPSKLRKRPVAALTERYALDPDVSDLSETDTDDDPTDDDDDSAAANGKAANEGPQPDDSSDEEDADVDFFSRPKTLMYASVIGVALMILLFLAEFVNYYYKLFLPALDEFYASLNATHDEL